MEAQIKRQDTFSLARCLLLACFQKIDFIPEHPPWARRHWSLFFEVQYKHTNLNTIDVFSFLAAVLTVVPYLAWSF